MSSDVLVALQDAEQTAKRPGLATRPANARKHPGKIVTDQIVHRRTHSQVVADAAAAEQAKEAEAARKLQLLNDVAIVKRRLELEMVETRRTSRTLAGAGTTINEGLATSNVPDAPAGPGRGRKKANDAVQQKNSDSNGLPAGKEKGITKPEERNSRKTNATGKAPATGTKKTKKASTRSAFPLTLPDADSVMETHLEKVRVKQAAKGGKKTAPSKRKKKAKDSDDDSKPESEDDDDSDGTVKATKRTDDSDSDSMADSMDVDGQAFGSAEGSDDDRDTAEPASEPEGKKPAKKKQKSGLSASERLDEQVRLLREQGFEVVRASPIMPVAVAKPVETQTQAREPPNPTKKKLKRGSEKISEDMDIEEGTALPAAEPVKKRGRTRPQPWKFSNAPSRDVIELEDKPTQPQQLQDRDQDPPLDERQQVEASIQNSPRVSLSDAKHFLSGSELSSPLAPQASSQVNEVERGRTTSRTPARPHNRAVKAHKSARSDESLEPRTPQYTRGSPSYNKPRTDGAVIVENPEEAVTYDPRKGSRRGSPLISSRRKNQITSNTTKISIVVHSPNQAIDDDPNPLENVKHRGTKTMKALVLPGLENRAPKDTLDVNQPDEKPSRSRSTSSTRSMSQLPCGVGADPTDRRWTEVFVPTFISFLGTLSNPWNATQKESLDALQAIWDVVFHDKPHTIKSTADKVYKTTRQKSYEWRNKFMFSAQQYLLAHFKQNNWTSRDDKESIQDYVECMLGEDYPFILKDPLVKGRGLFQSDMIATVFATHLHAIRGAVKVRNLLLTDNVRPCAALTLATLACYRALDTYSTGSEQHKGNFSCDLLVNESGYFYDSICNMREKTWQKIMAEGEAKVPAGARRSSSTAVVVRAPVERRALLQDESDSDG
ncbi:hypothetical protein SCHPADRAFT_941984 [Schizopora paradoxa]|uniref:DUF6532 domain-containing protein n=1 Tax=Schizopora paradoxa TaxID=27342 RepID=A0A0H2RI50_9AGAM|nr:hypothetical protein SCHPADRAFT_941984 [Schizopora paradoxa]